MRSLLEGLKAVHTLGARRVEVGKGERGARRYHHIMAQSIRILIQREVVYRWVCMVGNEEADMLAKKGTEPDKITARIEERTSAWTFLPKENSKSLQVMHYGLEEAKHDYNFFGNKSMLEVGEPLIATVVLYLSNVTRGGDIVFPKAELKTKSKIWSDCTKSDYALRPIKGNAILFFSLRPNALPDKSSSHGRCPVVEGEMWCATKFYHVRSVRRDISLSESDGNECTDEDDACSRWAAAGECQRNPVYMIGSPDYYGTCRKSCNAC